ncbi:MAG: amino acid adenylation domain-containing protein [Burkholderiaceae bacterium]
MTSSSSARRYPKNFVTHLRQLAAERPQDPALIVVTERDGRAIDSPVTYTMLDQRVRALAARLQSDFAPGERALLLLDNDDHYAVAFLACAYAGLIAVPAFPPESMRPQHLARLTGIARDAEACCVMTTAAIHPAMGAALEGFAGARVVAVDAIGVDGARAWKEREPGDGDIAFLQYTSGSTATPKGVMVSHGNLMANERVMEETLGLRAEDVFASWLPLYHDMGLIGGLLQPIHRGAPLVLMTPRFFLERPQRWLAAVTRHRVTVTGGPDFAFRLCVERIKDAQLDALDLASWRIAYTGAEPVRHDTLTGFGARFARAGFDASAFQPCYGLAEATLFITGGRTTDAVASRVFDADALGRGQAIEASRGTTLIGCGRIAAGHALRITDPASSDALPDGRVGEIWATGPSITRGYWDNAPATRDALVEHGGRTWLRTGDLGFLADGQLFVTGRSKDLIIVRGHNLYPQDIERAIEREVDAVRAGRVSAFAVAGPDGEGIGIAAEVSRGMQKIVQPEVLVGALSAAVSESCGEPLSAVALLQPGELPRTSSGKLQRQAARRGVADRSLDAFAIWEHGRFVFGGGAADAADADRADALDDDIERDLALIWREALRLDAAVPVPRDSHFFVLGGNSLAGVQVAARVVERWGVDYSVRALFEHPVLRDAAATVRSALAHGLRVTEALIEPLPAAQLSGPLPLSAAQQRQWFLWRLDPRGTAYHVAGALRIEGPVDEAALRSAFAGLFERHESLRTVFSPGEDSQGRQQVLPRVDFELPLIDLSEQPAEVAESAAAQRIRELNGQPFDLEHAPLLRAALIRQAADVHVLAVVMHHIVSDAASMQVLVDELGVRYRALVRGDESAPAPLPIRYTDFAAWQHAWLVEDGGRSNREGARSVDGQTTGAAPGARDRQLAYWLGELAGDEDPLALPPDHPRREVASHRAAHHRLALPVELAGALREAAARHGVTVFMLLLTGLQVLLHRYGGRRDIRVGVPIANRHRPRTEGVVGFFVNTLVLCARLDGRTALADALAQTRRAALDAQANQDLPFEQLVDVLRPERVVGSTPLFQVLFNHVTEDYRALEAAAGWRVTSLPMDSDVAQFDLTVEVRETADGGAGIHLAYADELFDAATMQGFGTRYLRVLEALVAKPSLAIGDVELIAGDERVRLLQAPAFQSEPMPAETLHALFERQAALQPDTDAVVNGSLTLTYAGLNERANRLAHRLVSFGVRPEDRVGVALERSELLPVALLAILKAGAAYVPLDPAYPPDRLSFVAADARVGLLLTERAIKEQAGFRSTAYAMVLAVDAIDLGMEPATNPGVPVHPDQLAYVIYTSGSTGRPKGAQLTHRNVTRLLGASAPSFGFGPQDTWTLFHSYAFDFSVWEIFGALCTGGRLVIVPYLTSRSPMDFLALLREQCVTVLNQTPSAFRHLIHAASRDDGRDGEGLSLRHVIFGGEALEAESLRPWFDRFGDVAPRLVNMFGITETTVHVTFRALAAADLDRRQFSPIGIPLPDLAVHVLDAELNLLPAGMPGELYVAGAGLARGYLERPALTAERFIADPFDDRGGRLYRTGDLVRRRDDGQLEYLGRIDQQVKIRGFRIELGEIDAQLLALPGVKDAATLALDVADGPQLASYVVPNEPGSVDAARLRDALARVLPDHMVPAVITVVEALPLTANGKLDRKALPRPERARRQAYEAPQGTTAAMLAAIWAEVLGVDQVGARDNFFDLGGHSLQVLKVHGLIEDRIGPAVTVIDLFKHPTIAGLAARIDQGGAASTEGMRREEARVQRQFAAMQRRRQARESREGAF